MTNVASDALQLLETPYDEQLSLSEEEAALFQRNKAWVNAANLTAGVFHAISFLAALIVSVLNSDKIYQAVVTATFTEWSGGVAVPTLRTLGTYSQSWTILPFPALTSLFHLALLFPPLRQHYHSITLNNGQPGAGWNWWRWVEYSITASLMTWTIAQLSGVTDLPTLACFVVLNALMQLVGGLGHELSNVGWRRDDGKSASWWLFALGFLPFVAIWAIVFAAFIIQASGASPPAFVYVAIFGMFLFFSAFTVPILLRYTRLQSALVSTNFSYELTFILLSFLAKFMLDWTLVIGSISRN